MSSPTSHTLQLEVVKNALNAVAEEMGVTLQRTAYSTNIKTRKDFSCAIFDARGRNIAHAFAIPSLLGSLPRLVPTALAEYERRSGRVLQEGESLITNDPFLGGAHLNDVAMITPVYYDGKLFGYVASVAHQVDVGGASHASLTISKHIYEEGLNIPPVRFVKDGVIDEEIFAIILNNIRATREVRGDLRAQIGANALGVRRLVELIDRWSAERLQQYVEQLMAYTESRVRVELSKLPKAMYAAEDFLDDDGHTDKPVRISLSLTIGEDGISVDFTDTEKQRPSPMNASLSVAYSSIAYFLKCIISDDIPVNDGFYRMIHINAPAGTFVNAQRPAGVVGGWVTGQRIVGALFRAFAECSPERAVAASLGIICNVGFGGWDPRRPGMSYAHYETIAGGTGGRLGLDGMDGVQGDLTNTENAPIEELEAQYPVRITHYGLIPDSDGAGRYRGGLGVRRDYLFPYPGTQFSVVSDRARFRPWGLFDGKDAASARYILRRQGAEIPLGSKFNLEVEPGDVVTICTPGGGGYGNPLERDPEAVARDVALGKISSRRAEEVYGVVMNNEGKLDREKTEQRRRGLG